MDKYEIIESVKCNVKNIKEYLDSLSLFIYELDFKTYPTDRSVTYIKSVNKSIINELKKMEKLVDEYTKKYSVPNHITQSEDIRLIAYKLKYFKKSYTFDNIGFNMIDYDLDSMRFDIVSYMAEIDQKLEGYIRDFKSKRQGYDFESKYIKLDAVKTFDELYDILSNMSDVKLIIRYRRIPHGHNWNKYASIEFLCVNQQDILNFLIVLIPNEIHLDRMRLNKFIDSKNKEVSGLGCIDFTLDIETQIKYLSILYNVPYFELYEDRCSSPILFNPFIREVYGNHIEYFNPKKYREVQKEIREAKYYEIQQKKQLAEEMIHKKELPDNISEINDLFDGISNLRQRGNDFEFELTLIASRYTYESIIKILNEHRAYVGMLLYKKFGEALQKKKAWENLSKEHFKPVSIVLTKDRRLVVMYSLKIDNIPEREYTPREKKNV